MEFDVKGRSLMEILAVGSCGELRPRRRLYSCAWDNNTIRPTHVVVQFPSNPGRWRLVVGLWHTSSTTRERRTAARGGPCDVWPYDTVIRGRAHVFLAAVGAHIETSSVGPTVSEQARRRVSRFRSTKTKTRRWVFDGKTRRRATTRSVKDPQRPLAMSARMPNVPILNVRHVPNSLKTHCTNVRYTYTASRLPTKPAIWANTSNVRVYKCSANDARIVGSLWFFFTVVPWHTTRTVSYPKNF